MSVYPPPTRYPAIFNPSIFSSYSNDSYLSTADANSTYAKLAGNQTIIGQETFAGGIKTNSIIPATGTDVSLGSSSLTTTGNVNTGALNVTGNITQSSGGYTTLRFLTATNSSYIARLTITNRELIMGSVTTLASSFGSAATTHTITSTELPLLASNGWNGELKVFVDAQNATDANNVAGVFFVVLTKPATTLTVTSINVYKSAALTTFTVAAASNTSLTVTVGPTACKMSWLFTGAL